MSVAPAPFWIVAFSTPEQWRTLASEDQIDMVLTRFPAEVVNQIAVQLPRLAAPDRLACLPHLLRHWATSRLRGAEIFDSTLGPNETRRRVGELRRAVQEAKARFRALTDEGLTMLSRELEGPDPVHQAYGLLMDFVTLADRILVPCDRAVARKLKPGPKPKGELVASIDSLVDIYVHMTGLEPTRTADPVKQRVTSPFVTFARACIEAYDPKTVRLEWSLRQALEARTRGENRPL